MSKLAILAILVTGFVCRLAYFRYFNGLYRIPGPPLASVTSFWKFYVAWTEQMPWTNVDLHKKYGPLVRIGPTHVSASSPESLNLIHVANKGFQKTNVYNLLQPSLEGSPLHNIFSTQDQGYHSDLKRSIGGLYSVTAMLKKESNIDRSISTFMKKLRGFTEGSSATVDMGAWFQYFAFDCISEINFSQPIGFLEYGGDLDGICKLDHDLMLYFGTWGQMPALEKIWSKVVSSSRVMKTNPLFEFTMELIDRRLGEPDSGQCDMLDSLIEIYKANKKQVGLREVVAAAYINIVTAHEVLAISLRAILYYLCRNRQCYNKLVAEIREADNAQVMSHPAKYTEIKALPYLNAVIDEALRIHPSTGTILERYVPLEGIELHGHIIPEGTTIGVNAWVMNRNEDVFGPDVETFRPERWLNASPPTLLRMKKNLLTWGAGARNCIGKNMATMQIFKVIVDLFRNFDVELVNPESEWRISGNWLTRQSNLDMRLIERSEAST